MNSERLLLYNNTHELISEDGGDEGEMLARLASPRGGQNHDAAQAEEHDRDRQVREEDVADGCVVESPHRQAARILPLEDAVGSMSHHLGEQDAAQGEEQHRPELLRPRLHQAEPKAVSNDDR